MDEYVRGSRDKRVAFILGETLLRERAEADSRNSLSGPDAPVVSLTRMPEPTASTMLAKYVNLRRERIVPDTRRQRRRLIKSDFR